MLRQTAPLRRLSASKSSSRECGCRLRQRVSLEEVVHDRGCIEVCWRGGVTIADRGRPRMTYVEDPVMSDQTK